MSAKPTTLPTLATDANYPAGPEPEAGTPTKVAITGGNQATGYRPKGKLPATEFNWLLHALCEWAAYLSDGDLVGPIAIDGAFSVTGTGPVVVDIAGAVEVTAPGGFIVDADTEFATNRVVAVQGPDGDLWHGEYTLSWSPDNGWTFFSGGFGTGASGIHPEDAFGALYSFFLETNGNKVRFIPHGLRPGDRIKRLTIYWTASVTGNPPTPKIYNFDNGGISTQTLTSRGASYYKSAAGLERQEYVVDSPAPIGKTQLNSPTVTDWFGAWHPTINLTSVVTLTYIHGISVVYDRLATPILS